MPPFLHSVYCLGLALLPLTATAAEMAGQETSEDWESLLSNSEDLLEWSADPLADLNLNLDATNTFLTWTVGLEAGWGTSDNFLKRKDPVSSSYLALELDGFLNRMGPHSSLTVLAFLEAFRYQRESEAQNENTAFLHSNWTRFSALWDWGINLDLFYGDQIYDASILLTGTPVGETFRQTRPKVDLFLDWAMGEKDLLSAHLGIQRSIFDDSANDYWKPLFSASWEHAFSTSLTTIATAAYFQEVYDERMARLPDGFFTPTNETLRVHGGELELAIAWSPPSLQSLSLSAKARLTLEDSENGDHEDVLRWLGLLEARWRASWADISLTGLWQNNRFSQRQVSFVETRPLHQIYRSLQVDLEKDLWRGLSLGLHGEWTDFTSRDGMENFTERRVELRLDWSY